MLQYLEDLPKKYRLLAELSLACFGFLWILSDLFNVQMFSRINFERTVAILVIGLPMVCIFRDIKTYWLIGLFLWVSWVICNVMAEVFGGMAYSDENIIRASLFLAILALALFLIRNIRGAWVVYGALYVFFHFLDDIFRNAPEGGMFSNPRLYQDIIIMGLSIVFGLLVYFMEKKN